MSYRLVISEVLFPFVLSGFLFIISGFLNANLGYFLKVSGNTGGHCRRCKT